jgi:hypothetical protein
LTEKGTGETEERMGRSRDRNADDCCVGNGEMRGYFIWRRETVRQVK